SFPGTSASLRSSVGRTLPHRTRLGDPAMCRARLDAPDCSWFVPRRTDGGMDMRADLDTSRMTRPIHAMPPEVAAALERAGLMAAYEARPAYQQNDYVGWITRARRPETRQKRLDQMLAELATGGVYMKMAWKG